MILSEINRPSSKGGIMKIYIVYLFKLLILLNIQNSYVQAAIIEVGQGSVVDFGNSEAVNPSHDLINLGVVNFANSDTTFLNFENTASANASANTANINIMGDWVNSGSFTAGNSAVNIQDGVSNSTKIIGGSIFNILSIVSNTGKSIELQAGQQQIISTRLELIGVTGNLLKISSDTPGTHAELALANNATQLINYVEVTDNHGTSQVIAPGLPQDYNSVQGSNVRGWFGVPLAYPVPLLNLFSLILLTLSCILLAVHTKNKGVKL